MLSDLFYLIRSKTDGKYLVACSQAESSPDRPPPAGYVLLFREHFDALSYLNTHAGELADRFAIETLAGSQLGGLLSRWQFQGVGIVQDPLLPSIEFLQRDRSF
jgi:hypothetical protein